jgi:hypothetical protein
VAVAAAARHAPSRSRARSELHVGWSAGPV